MTSMNGCISIINTFPIEYCSFYISDAPKFIFYRNIVTEIKVLYNKNTHPRVIFPSCLQMSCEHWLTVFPELNVIFTSFLLLTPFHNWNANWAITWGMKHFSKSVLFLLRLRVWKWHLLFEFLYELYCLGVYCFFSFHIQVTKPRAYYNYGMRGMLQIMFCSRINLK